jgi:hypothetical protein
MLILAGVAEALMSVAVLKRAFVAPKRSRLSKLGLLLVALFAGILAVTGCTTGSSGSSLNPINPANRPTTITCYTNGQLPSSQLYVVNSNCTLYRPTVDSYEAMIAAARSAGVQLSAAECYRDYSGQVYERNYWCKLGICANAAVPGYSNHGWGKAVDLRDQNGSLTFNSVGYRWMVAHAGQYGWNHPGGVNEAWHWEWVGDGGTMHGYAVRPDLMNWNP